MELLGRQETWNITYDYALGETASWFYTRIRDEAAIYGRRCARSGRVLVPPWSFSDETLQPTTLEAGRRTHSLQVGRIEALIAQ